MYVAAKQIIITNVPDVVGRTGVPASISRNRRTVNPVTRTHVRSWHYVSDDIEVSGVLILRTRSHSLLPTERLGSATRPLVYIHTSVRRGRQALFLHQISS